MVAIYREMASIKCNIDFSKRRAIRHIARRRMGARHYGWRLTHITSKWVCLRLWLRCISGIYPRSRYAMPAISIRPRYRHRAHFFKICSGVLRWPWRRLTEDRYRWFQISGRSFHRPYFRFDGNPSKIPARGLAPKWEACRRLQSWHDHRWCFARLYQYNWLQIFNENDLLVGRNIIRTGHGRPDGDCVALFAFGVLAIWILLSMAEKAIDSDLSPSTGRPDIMSSTLCMPSQDRLSRCAPRFMKCGLGKIFILYPSAIVIYCCQAWRHHLLPNVRPRNLEPWKIRILYHTLHDRCFEIA